MLPSVVTAICIGEILSRQNYCRCHVYARNLGPVNIVTYACFFSSLCISWIWLILNSSITYESHHAKNMHRLPWLTTQSADC
jgi:hypothetical protein